jgi:hypothetical protein
MILSSSQFLAVSVPYVHILPKYRSQLDVSLPTEDDPKSLHVAYCPRT